MVESIPVIDISCLFDKYKTENEWTKKTVDVDEDFQNLVKSAKNGFETWGFIYVKGHGISEDLIKTSFQVSADFFHCSEELKIKYQRNEGISVGYLPSKGEVFNKTKPLDIKETLDFAPIQQAQDLNGNLSEHNPELVSILTKLYTKSHAVGLKLLRLLAVAMEIPPEHFVKMHSHIGNLNSNGTTLRSLYYPPVIDNTKEDQQRCSEHTDYGTITLLFQDEAGGLEVLSPFGYFVKVKPIPGTIVINAGDLMKCWSNGKFLSTVHRVTVPQNMNQRGKARQSIAFFIHPDYDVTIKYKAKTGEMKERNALEHLKLRFKTTIEVNRDEISVA